jgi:hypothetical protein
MLARDRTRIATQEGRLTSAGPHRELGLERWHIGVTSRNVRIVVGSFNCDFAESVTFSTARHLYAPALEVGDAIVRSVDARVLRAAPALRGVALQLGAGPLDAVAFASYQSLDLYQYGEWLHDGASPAPTLADGTPLRAVTVAGAAHERTLWRQPRPASWRAERRHRRVPGRGTAVRPSRLLQRLVGLPRERRLRRPGGTHSPPAGLGAAAR